MLSGGSNYALTGCIPHRRAAPAIHRRDVACQSLRGVHFGRVRVGDSVGGLRAFGTPHVAGCAGSS